MIYYNTLSHTGSTFKGYSIAHGQSVQQELVRVNLSSFNSYIKQQRDSFTAVQVMPLINDDVVRQRGALIRACYHGNHNTVA